MKIRTILKSAAVGVSLIAVGAFASPQITQILKVLGVGAAVQKFGPEINRGINKLSKHTDTYEQTTKVVPILSIGVGKSSAVGAAQVMGPKPQVAQVKAVAAPETELFGKEIRIRAMIPIANEKGNDLRPVPGVGVSGIVDLKL